MLPHGRERVGLLLREQLDRGGLAEAVDEVRGLRRMVQQEMAIDRVERGLLDVDLDGAHLSRSGRIRSPRLCQRLRPPIAISSVTSARSRRPFVSTERVA